MDASTTTSSLTTDDQKPQASNKKEDWELQRDALKVLADDAFRTSDYSSAVEHYTQALSLDPNNILLLSNRSAANLKLNNKSKALSDAKNIVNLDPTFAKGHSRLAAALHSLQRWGPAKEAYEAVLKLDKQNVAAKKGLEECEAKLKQQQEAEEQERAVDKEETATKDVAAEKESTEASAESGKPKSTDNDNEDDLLDDFFNEVEDVTKPKPVEEEDQQQATNAIRNQTTDLGTPQAQIERLLAPNYQWRNLNPFYVLDFSHDASLEDISRRYKALSLLLHPDKCRDLNDAKEAYDQVQAAKRHLDDEGRRNHARQLIIQGNKQGKSDWKKANAPSDELSEYQSKAVQKIFAEIEFKRRQVEERERKQERREREQEEQELQKERNAMKFDKSWREDTRVEKRIGSWRDFQKKKPANKKQKL